MRRVVVVVAKNGMIDPFLQRTDHSIGCSSLSCLHPIVSSVQVRANWCNRIFSIWNPGQACYFPKSYSECPPFSSHGMKCLDGQQECCREMPDLQDAAGRV